MLKGAPYRCGQKAAQALDSRISDGVVTCEPKDRDRYGRIVAICRAYGEDLAAWMTGLGWALAFRRYSTQYVPAEELAERRKIGHVERSVRAALGVEGARLASRTQTSGIVPNDGDAHAPSHGC